MGRSARCERKELENCGSLLQIGEALLSLMMLFSRLVERRDGEGIRAVGVGPSKVGLVIAPFIESDVIRAWHAKPKVLCGIDELDCT